MAPGQSVSHAKHQTLKCPWGAGDTLRCYRGRCTRRRQCFIYIHYGPSRAEHQSGNGQFAVSRYTTFSLRRRHERRVSMTEKRTLNCSVVPVPKEDNAISAVGPIIVSEGSVGSGVDLFGTWKTPTCSTTLPSSHEAHTRAPCRWAGVTAASGIFTCFSGEPAHGHE